MERSNGFRVHCDIETSKAAEKNGMDHQEGRKEMFYLTTHSTHFIYGYMASDIW